MSQPTPRADGIRLIIFDVGNVLLRLHPERLIEALRRESRRSVDELMELVHAYELVDPLERGTMSLERFFEQLKGSFSEDELVELVFAAALFIWGNHFNITMRVDTDPESAYPHNLAYAEAGSSGRPR